MMLSLLYYLFILLVYITKHQYLKVADKSKHAITHETTDQRALQNHLGFREVRGEM